MTAVFLEQMAKSPTLYFGMGICMNLPLGDRAVCSPSYRLLVIIVMKCYVMVCRMFQHTEPSCFD